MVCRFVSLDYSVNMNLFIYILGLCVSFNSVKCNGSTTPSMLPQLRTYTVSTVLSAPWVMVTDQVGTDPNTTYSGFLVDLLAEIARLSNFRYQIRLSSARNYGMLGYPTGAHEAIIGELITGEADIGLADLIVSDERAKVVSFTTPFASTGTQILLKKPMHTGRTMLMLTKPFTLGLWCVLLVALVLTVVGVYLVDKYTTSNNGVSIKDSFLIVWSSILYQGHGRRTVYPSSCLLLCCWWLFTLGILLAYVTSLSGYLASTSTTKPILPFTTFSEMADQTDVEYGGSVSLRLNPNYELHRKLNRFMNSRYTFFSDKEKVIDRVVNGDGKFAAIVDGLRGEHWVNNNCDLLLLREQLIHIHYGIACSPGEFGQNLCANISEAIDQLQENGFVDRLMKTWWYGNSKCPVTSEKNYISAASVSHVSFRPLNSADVAPLLVVLAFGMLASVLLFLFERHRRKRTWRHEKNISSVETAHNDCQIPLDGIDDHVQTTNHT